MTKNDTILARHDERLKVVEGFGEKLDTLVVNSNNQNVNIERYRNSNVTWGLISNAAHGLITSLALLASGNADKILAYLSHLYS